MAGIIYRWRLMLYSFYYAGQREHMDTGTDGNANKTLIGH